jgi:hypothetical protein
VLVRFAGPRLSGGHDGLVPVDLRSGGRALGSALSWEQPQGLSPFAEGSPFFGLTADPTIKVERQVLAEPSATLPSRVWASLEDGTPLVTANAQGKGLVVLFHVTANADWSNLPLSGLFVEMLKRLADMAPAAGSLCVGSRRRRRGQQCCRRTHRGRGLHAAAHPQRLRRTERTTSQCAAGRVR